MPLSPEDVVRKSFRSAPRLKRGYDEEEVDAFLEEVVAELRSLRAQVDELKAAAARPATPGEVESSRVAREREQLDLIRSERQELVSELGALQARLDKAQQQVAEADDRAAEAERLAAEAEARRARAAEEEAELQHKVARAQAVYDDLRAAHDTLVADLRGWRVATETAAGEVFGEVPPEPPSDATPADDIATMAAVARMLHDEHVRAGREEGELLLNNALTTSNRTLEEAKAESTRLREEATARADQTLTEAMERAEALRAEVVREVTDLRKRAREEHDQLVAEAQAERAGILADLNARREVLERRLHELDGMQSGLRDRLRLALTEQLTVLEDDRRWVGDGRPAAPPQTVP